MSTLGSEPLLFGFLPSRELLVECSTGQITSDAGLLLIRQLDQQWGYTGLSGPHQDPATAIAGVLVAPTGVWYSGRL